jgi:tetratricopeptide (TPR) repeat protein
VVIAVTIGAIVWFAYLGPIRQQLEIAKASYARGEYAAATTAAERVLALDSNQIEASLVLARTKAATGDSAGALLLYARVIKGWPNDAAVFYEMASFERLIGSTSVAVPHLKAALTLEPDNELYLRELVMAYIATGKARVAADLLLERARDTDRSVAERADLYVRAAGVLVEARAQDDAKAALAKALGLVPKHPAATRMLEQLR